MAIPEEGCPLSAARARPLAPVGIASSQRSATGVMPTLFLAESGCDDIWK